jgi:predicted S18 family serine protease
MSKKLNDKELALIMSYVDGQLDPSEASHVEKMISENIEAKAAFEDLKLSTSFYGDYVSSIKENSEKIIAKNKDHVEKEKKSFFSAIFQKPMRNFVAYPIAAVFIFTIGFQMNSVSFRGIDQNNEQFRGIEKQEDVNERIKDLEKEVAELKEQINNYIKEIENLNKRLKEKN